MKSKKGGASSGGIQLSFDDKGEPHIAQPEEILTECLGGVKCRYCEIVDDDSGAAHMICCTPSGANQSVFNFKACPEGKWVPIVGLGEAPVLKSAMFDCGWDMCCNCGTSSMWKLKNSENWICAACHPPSPHLNKNKIERRERAAILEKKGLKTL